MNEIAAQIEAATAAIKYAAKRTRPPLTEKVQSLLHHLNETPSGLGQAILADAMEEDELVDQSNPAAQRRLDALRDGTGTPRYLHPTRFGYAALDHPPLSIADIRRISTANGSHYFDRDTLRSFRSRPSSKIYSGPGGVYFVDSTQWLETEPRDYTVQRFVPETGEVTSFVHPEGKPYRDVPYKELQHLSDFRFADSKDAHRLAAHLAEHGRLPEHAEPHQ